MKDVELHIVLGGVAISPRFVSSRFNLKEILKKEGHKNIHEVHINMEGDDLVVKAKTVGIGIIEFSSIFYYIKPDLVVVRGDRFEMLAAAVAAANMNITLAHIEGGDVSGTIDESIRHSITKLSHYHFATNEKSKERIIRMGENKERTFNFGSPDVEVVKKISKSILPVKKVKLEKVGSGSEFDENKNFLMVMYHPVTSELDLISKNVRNLIEVIHEMGVQTLWFWPNYDAGAEKISHELRKFKDMTEDHKIKFLRYLPPHEFLSLLSKTKCFIGNSSSGIKECSYLGIPVVDIGSRQNGRLKPKNVINCGNEKQEIKEAIEKQIKKGRCESLNIYDCDGTSKKICKVLASCNLIVQKKFED
jgi:UDP-hydrolysing UDP-N-acetyl-D-glucosamine 2-epimerase